MTDFQLASVWAGNRLELNAPRLTQLLLDQARVSSPKNVSVKIFNQNRHQNAAQITFRKPQIHPHMAGGRGDKIAHQKLCSGVRSPTPKADGPLIDSYFIDHLFF